MDQPGRIMAVDYGHARIGIAVSDPLRILASGVETIKLFPKGNIDAAVVLVAERIVRYEAILIVVGLPLHTSGAASSMSLQVQKFCAQLAKTTNIPIQTFDERFTSVIASKIMRVANLHTKEAKRKVVDQIAAEILLQDFMTYLKNKETR